MLSRVKWNAVGGRPRIPDEVVFAKLVAFLSAVCAWDVFDELCRGGEVSGRTCRHRFGECRDLGIFGFVCNELRAKLPVPAIAQLAAIFIRSRGGGEDLVGLTRHGKGSKIQALTDEDSMPRIVPTDIAESE